MPGFKKRVAFSGGALSVTSVPSVLSFHLLSSFSSLHVTSDFTSRRAWGDIKSQTFKLSRRPNQRFKLQRSIRKFENMKYLQNYYDFLTFALFPEATFITDRQRWRNDDIKPLKKDYIPCWHYLNKPRRAALTHTHPHVTPLSQL